MQVIEYIRFLQEKVQKHEATFPEWNQENAKILPWVSHCPKAVITIIMKGITALGRLGLNIALHVAVKYVFSISLEKCTGTFVANSALSYRI
jgi:hypothetical protein